MGTQSYPRIEDEKSKYHGYLDDSYLDEHKLVIKDSEIEKIIKNAIIMANKKSGRTILNVPSDMPEKDASELYKKKGKELFQYFTKYYGDPASSAYGCLHQNYEKVAKEQFRNWTLQKERMNSGWRYQFIAKDGAIKSKRFVSVSDIGTAEADFNAIIGVKNSNKTVSIYVSVKNRVNTMGGQDWPKAISALEEVANKDKNRTGPYICVFGIAMDRGLRLIKKNSKTKAPFSVNTELWKSDYFWPFFTNLSYGKIIRSVLSVLIELGSETNKDIDIPQELITSFGNECRKHKLLDSAGKFNDAYKLVEIFCEQKKHE
ncbi:MAG: hypothetical protein AABY52_02350 [Deltaproteobacteria bacterium]